MHIPASMLHGTVCPVTFAVGAAGLSFAAFAAYKVDDKPSSVKFAAVTAMIFALQMLNFPIANGTSGHLLGGVLAVSLLGVPFAVLSVSLVLAVQAFFFGDGGVNALGANILNMAFLGSAASGIFLEWLKERNVPKILALALASWVSVVIAATACSIEIASAGAVALNKVFVAMLSVHALIGVGEGLLTVGVVFLLSSLACVWQKNKNTIAFASFGVAIVAALFSPFASSFPDGLESVAAKLSFLEFHEVTFPAVFREYHAAFINNASLSTILAGVVGVAIITVFVFVTSRLLKNV
jgi:cobalt/nickel transport system permease protein